MNKLRIIVLLLLYSYAAQGQTWSEFFKQKKTQIRYSLGQIAGMKAYAEFLQKGYRVASSGINAVKSYSNGEFSLHKDFFVALSTINPAINNHPKAISVVAMQLQISRIFDQVIRTDGISTAEREYAQAVKRKIISECGADLGELLLVVKAGKIRMGDGERLQRLDKTFASMQQKLYFSRVLFVSVQQTVSSRFRQAVEILLAEKLYNITN